jgi:hypothetical protein
MKTAKQLREDYRAKIDGIHEKITNPGISQEETISIKYDMFEVMSCAIADILLYLDIKED